MSWSVKTFLEKNGYAVTEAKEGTVALDLLAKKPCDIIITELTVDGFDGLVLADRAKCIRPGSQVIIVTARGTKESAITALRRGVFDFIEKPFPVELLLYRVEKAMEKIRMNEELVRLSRTDGLTGLFNQRYFWEILEREINRTRRQGHPLSVLLADMDSFKEYNDRHGHLAGDGVLARAANALKDVCRRDIDMAFRYGGDEFIVILPEATLGVAQDIAGRLHRLVLAAGLDGLTLSIGLAELENGQDYKTFISHADEAMYLAKQMGGNRTVTFSHIV